MTHGWVRHLWVRQEQSGASFLIEQLLMRSLKGVQWTQTMANRSRQIGKDVERLRSIMERERQVDKANVQPGWIRRFWRSLGIKRGWIIFGRRSRSLKKHLRGLQEHVGKKVREAKAQLELKMETSIKDNKNVFTNMLIVKARVNPDFVLYWMREAN